MFFTNVVVAVRCRDCDPEARSACNYAIRLLGTIKLLLAFQTSYLIFVEQHRLISDKDLQLI